MSNKDILLLAEKLAKGSGTTKVKIPKSPVGSGKRFK